MDSQSAPAKDLEELVTNLLESEIRGSVLLSESKYRQHMAIY